MTTIPQRYRQTDRQLTLASVVVLVPWSWSWGASRPALPGLGLAIFKSWPWFWNGVMIFELCLITYGLDQTVCWRSQCLLSNVQKRGHTGGYTLQFTLCIYLFTFSRCLYKRQQHKCKIMGASHIKRTVPVTACAVSENFLYYAERLFISSGLLMRRHRARMSNQLLSQLVFLTCNKHVEFDRTLKAELLSLQCTGCLMKNDPVSYYQMFTEAWIYISAAFDSLTFELCFNKVYFKHTDFTVDGALTHVECWRITTEELV